MSKADYTFEMDLDEEPIEKDLAQLRQTAELTSKQVLETTRKGYQALTLTLDIFGQTLPFWIDLLAQSVFLFAETLSGIAAAESLSGWFAVKAGLTFALASAMFYRGLMIQQTRSEVENKLNSSIQLVNILSSF